MATKEVFGELCRRVCAQQGWELLPTGVQVRFGDGRHQVVALEFLEYEGEELVRLFTTIGAVDGMTVRRLTAALRVNASLAHGALAVKDDELVMTDTLMLEDADPGEIEASIRYLAETADYYEKTIFGTDEY